MKENIFTLLRLIFNVLAIAFLGIMGFLELVVVGVFIWTLIV